MAQDDILAAVSGALEGFSKVYVPRKQAEFEDQLLRQRRAAELNQQLAIEQAKIPNELLVARAKEDYADQLARQRDAEKHTREMSKIEAENNLEVPVLDANGKVIGKTKKGAIKVGEGKQPTEAQSNANTYATRAEQAEGVIGKLSGYIDSFPTMSGKDVVSYSMQANAPDVANKLKNPNFRQYEQAKLNFLTAVLRKESGAVISKEEIASGNKQYFPLPGDDQETIKQKAANRRVAIEGIKGAAGSAYKPLALPVVGGGASDSGWSDAEEAELRELEKKLGR